MTTSVCEHCGQPVFWYARHSVWLHFGTRSRLCTVATRPDESAPTSVAAPVGHAGHAGHVRYAS